LEVEKLLQKTRILLFSILLLAIALLTGITLSMSLITVIIFVLSLLFLITLWKQEGGKKRQTDAK
jgi:heme/copper-type cytochrome/quinol oxidase subunit 2